MSNVIQLEFSGEEESKSERLLMNVAEEFVGVDKPKINPLTWLSRCHNGASHMEFHTIISISGNGSWPASSPARTCLRLLVPVGLVHNSRTDILDHSFNLSIIALANGLKAAPKIEFARATLPFLLQ